MQVKFPSENEFPSEKKSDVGQKLYQNRVLLALLLFAFVVGSFLFMRMSLKGSRFVKEYLLADTMLSRLAKGEVESRGKVVHFLEKYPELRPFFEHSLQQSFLIEGNLSEAKKISQRARERLAHMDSRYQKYTATSMKIEEGQYEAALEEANVLGESFVQGGFEGFEHLYVFNLIRMAFLEKSLGHMDAHTKRCQEVARLLTPENKTLSDAVKNEIISHFSDEMTSIFQFFAAT